MSTMSSQYKPYSQLGLADQKLNFHRNNNLICLTLTEARLGSIIFIIALKVAA